MGSVECFGREASNKAKELLFGEEVMIETDPTQGTLDKYGRTLAYVFLKDGTNFNKYMIEQGYGHEYTYRAPYRYQAEFKQAQLLAREQERGLWAPGVCDATQVEPLVVAQTPGGAVTQFSCSSDTYNCGDFKTHAAAQEVFDGCGGTENDVHRLDRDKDGIVCESLP